MPITVPALVGRWLMHTCSSSAVRCQVGGGREGRGTGGERGGDVRWDLRQGGHLALCAAIIHSHCASNCNFHCCDDKTSTTSKLQSNQGQDFNSIKLHL